MTNSTPSETRTQILREGDEVLVRDKKQRTYLITLRSGSKFESHIGVFPHDELIGMEEGTWIKTNKGHILLALRPTMSEFSLDMPRIATIGYPKDVGPILIYGDIFPGAKILEAGCGSGAITMALSRAIGPTGSLTACDIRSDMLARAKENTHRMLGHTDNITFEMTDVYEAINCENLDRVVLDLPEPWQVVDHAAKALVLGGIFISFLPTILQVHELTQKLNASESFTCVETFETLFRNWSVKNRSVRPSHRMIGHTGFITTARRCKSYPT